jgi:hypothetical protein
MSRRLEGHDLLEYGILSRHRLGQATDKEIKLRTNIICKIKLTIVPVMSLRPTDGIDTGKAEHVCIILRAAVLMVLTRRSALSSLSSLSRGTIYPVKPPDVFQVHGLDC